MAGANALFALDTVLAMLEGWICVIVILPLFVAVETDGDRTEAALGGDGRVNTDWNIGSGRIVDADADASAGGVRFGMIRSMTCETGRNPALFSMGESWHDNHHAFPGSVRLGLLRGEWDAGWWLIQRLKCRGLAWSINARNIGAARGQRCIDWIDQVAWRRRRSDRLTSSNEAATRPPSAH